MAAYYKVDVVLNSQAVTVGLPSPQSVTVTLPTVGPAGPAGATGATGATGAVGPQGPAGTGIETLTTKGDLLSRNDSAAIRVGIGSTGQILKVSAQGLPTWANESGAVTSVNGQTGAVNVAAELHAAEHEMDEADEIQATAALVETDVAALNGVYFWDGTLTSGRPNFFKPGTRKNTKLQYNSGTAGWELIQNVVAVGQSNANSASRPWAASPWEDPRTPPQVTTITVTRLGLERMVQKLAETGVPSVGTSSTDFVAGNDARLSDSRTPSSTLAHKASHATGGTDVLNPSDIGAAPASHSHVLADITDAGTAAGFDADQDLGTTDTPTFAELTAGSWQSPTGQVVVSFDDNFLRVTSEDELSLTVAAGQIRLRDWQNNNTAVFEAANNLTSDRTYDLPDRSGELMIVGDAPASHTHGNLTNDGKVGSTSGLPLKTGTAGVVEAGAFGTSAGQFAEGNHTHADLHTRSHAITSTSDHTAGNHKVFYSNGSGQIEELALGASGTVLQSNGTATAPTFETPAASGVTGAASSASDVLGVSGANITGVDANADRIVFWDDSASALKHLTVGSGLSITDVTLSATSTFDPASPGAIGNTTPSTGAFTTLSTAPAANTTAFTSTGYSLTGSNAQSLVDLAGTWNTTGTPSAIKLNITDTASNASSLLMQLQTGGTNRLTVNKSGDAFGRRFGTSTYYYSAESGFGSLYAGGVEVMAVTNSASVGVAINSNYSIGLSTSVSGAAADVRMWRDAAAVWALRDGTNAMEMRCYGTFTSSTNYQRMTIKSVKQTLSALSGASATTTGTFIPDGAVVVGVTTRVATALTGAAGYTIGDGTDADRWGDITGTAIGTTSDNRDWTAGTIECFTAGGEITLTAKTSNFTAGAIEICVFYLAGQAD